MILSRQHFTLNGHSVVERLQIAPPFRFQAVFQNEACFLYFREGDAMLAAPTEKLRLQKQEGVLLKCGNYFADFISQPSVGACEVFAIHLYPAVLREIYQHEIPEFVTTPAKGAFAQKVASSQVLERFIESLIFYFENPALVNDELLRLKLKELVLLLLQSQHADTIQELIAYLFVPRKASIHAVVNAHVHSPLSVEELATLCGLSLSSFKRAFYEQYHCSPAHYMKSKRLSRAAEILRFPGISVAEVAFGAGFENPAHFARSFRRQFGCSPTEYRQKQKA